MLVKEYGRAKAFLVKRWGLEPEHHTVPDENGEFRFLKLVSAFPETAQYDSVIDVGANKGDWTAEAVKQFSRRSISTFYCVEPIPTFMQEIKKKFGARSDVKLIERVLSRTAGGTAEIFEVGGGGRMYRDYRGSDAASLAPSKKKIVSHQVPISTGDQVFGPLGIRPYLIKIDCDGHDLHVLRGFEQMLRKQRPLIQFEYSDFWIGAGSRLRDACALFRQMDYRTYKMFPDRLIEFNYNPLFETFGYQNIVAAPKEFRSFSNKTIELAAV